MPELTTIPFQTISGDTTTLADFNGKVKLLVNVASKCGSTPQYKGLQELYEQYQSAGLVIIGFPANNFKSQEPGTNEEIQEFCTVNYGVTFPMMAKISVKGEDIHPLYELLTENADTQGDIGWNFTKFLLARDGTIIARFDTKVEPEDPKIVDEIEALLAE
jgi:glutathione peroxidase